jgi:hypothetical protein
MNCDNTRRVCSTVKTSADLEVYNANITPYGDGLLKYQLIIQFGYAAIRKQYQYYFLTV